MVGQEDCAMTVAQRNSCHVPEDEHKPPLLVVDIPSGHNALFSFAWCIGVQKVSEHQKGHFATDISKLFVLSCSRGEGDKQKSVPGQPHLEEHLKVKILE